MKQQMPTQQYRAVRKQSHDLGLEDVEEAREVVELSRDASEMSHAEVDSHSVVLTHPDVDLPPWLVQLDKHRCRTGGRGEVGEEGRLERKGRVDGKERDERGC